MWQARCITKHVSTGQVCIDLFPVMHVINEFPHALRQKSSWPAFTCISKCGSDRIHHELSFDCMLVFMTINISTPFPIQWRCLCGSCFAIPFFFGSLGFCGPFDLPGAQPKLPGKVFHHVGFQTLKYYNLSKADFGGMVCAHIHSGGIFGLSFSQLHETMGNNGWNR